MINLSARVLLGNLFFGQAVEQFFTAEHLGGLLLLIHQILERLLSLKMLHTRALQATSMSEQSFLLLTYL